MHKKNLLKLVKTISEEDKVLLASVENMLETLSWVKNFMNNYERKNKIVRYF